MLCKPMSAVTARATGSRSRTRTEGSPAADGASATSRVREWRTGACRNCGTRTRKASRAGIAHSPRVGRQPPPTRESSGTVTPEARAAPADSAVEYRPIIRPRRCEKSRLITAGMITLAIAIAAPMTTVPAKSPARLGWSRSAIPAASATIVAPSSRCRPSRRLSAGVTKAKAPKATTGMVVRRLTTTSDRPRSALMSDSTGLTEATPMRRFNAAVSRPTADRTAPSLPRTLVPGRVRGGGSWRRRVIWAVLSVPGRPGRSWA